MHELRSEVFKRSEGHCENLKANGKRCTSRITWFNFELAHIVARSHGGSDTAENTLAKCRQCHEQEHGVPKWSKRA